MAKKQVFGFDREGARRVSAAVRRVEQSPSGSSGRRRSVVDGQPTRYTGVLTEDLPLDGSAEFTSDGSDETFTVHEIWGKAKSGNRGEILWNFGEGRWEFVPPTYLTGSLDGSLTQGETANFVVDGTGETIEVFGRYGDGADEDVGAALKNGGTRQYDFLPRCDEEE